MGDVLKTVLNVGSGPESIKLPKEYIEWEEIRLDINPEVLPHIKCDARRIGYVLDEEWVDAVFCHHNLEHYYRHELTGILRGFMHVLKPGGWVDIHVPDLMFIADYIAAGKSLHDTVYYSPAGPIRALDMIYGHENHTATGNEYYLHKTGFTPQYLLDLLIYAGFENVTCKAIAYEIRAKGYKPKEMS